MYFIKEKAVFDLLMQDQVYASVRLKVLAVDYGASQYVVERITTLVEFC